MFLLRKIRCHGGIVLCTIWVTISLLVMVSNTVLLMNYYKRSGKHRKIRSRTIFVARDYTEHTLSPTSITEKFSLELSQHFQSKYNSTNHTTTVSFKDFYQTVTGIQDHSYNRTKCPTIRTRKKRIHKTNLVTQMNCSRDYTMIILVSSNISHFDRRTLIRHTWGNERYWDIDKWKVFFLVGTTLDKVSMRKLSCEAEMHRDIILGDTIEDFFNLTYKVQMGFEWSIRYCKYKFLLKADDDVFVNIPAAFNFLYDKETPQTRLYAGNVNYESPVVRSGKYAVSKKEYWKKVYPRYCSGGGFILSYDVVKMMTLRIVRKKTKPLKIDDAYVGILALANGVDSLHYDNFRMYEKEDKCLYNSTYIIHHPVKTRPCMFKLFAHHMMELDIVSRVMR